MTPDSFLPSPVGLAIVLIAYIIGTIPFGVLVARWMGSPDPRTRGSGNIGCTNVLRVAGTRAAALTLLMDATKGALAVWVAGTLMGTTAWAEASGIATVAGHVFPLWAKFRGGKGVATAIGALLVLSTTAACALIGLWMLVLSVTRYVSLASVIAAAALPVAATFLRAGITVFAYVVAAMIILRHRENLVRLWHGNEAKLGARSR